MGSLSGICRDQSDFLNQLVGEMLVPDFLSLGVPITIQSLLVQVKINEYSHFHLRIDIPIVPLAIVVP